MLCRNLKYQLLAFAVLFSANAFSDTNPVRWYPGFPGETQHDRLTNYKRLDGLCLILPDNSGQQFGTVNEDYSLGNIEDAELYNPETGSPEAGKKCVGIHTGWVSHRYLDVWVADIPNLQRSFLLGESQSMCKTRSNSKYGVINAGSCEYYDVFTTRRASERANWITVKDVNFRDDRLRQYTIPDTQTAVNFIKEDFSLAKANSHRILRFLTESKFKEANSTATFNSSSFGYGASKVSDLLAGMTATDSAVKPCRIVNPKHNNYQAIGYVEQTSSNQPTCITPYPLGVPESPVTGSDFETFALPLSWTKGFVYTPGWQQSSAENQVGAVVRQLGYEGYQPWVNTAVKPLKGTFTVGQTPSSTTHKSTLTVSTGSNRGEGNKYICLATAYDVAEQSYKTVIGVTVFAENHQDVRCVSGQTYTAHEGYFYMPFFHKNFYPISDTEAENGQYAFIDDRRTGTIQAYIDEDLSQRDAALARGDSPYELDLNIKPNVSSVLKTLRSQPPEYGPSAMLLPGKTPESSFNHILDTHFTSLLVEVDRTTIQSNVYAYISTQLQQHAIGESHLLKYSDSNPSAVSVSTTKDNYTEKLGNYFVSYLSAQHNISMGAEISRLDTTYSDLVGSTINIEAHPILLALGGFKLSASNSEITPEGKDLSLGSYRYGSYSSSSRYEHYKNYLLSANVGASQLGLYPGATLPSTVAALATVLNYIETFYGRAIAEKLLNDNKFNSRKLHNAIELAFQTLTSEDNVHSPALTGVVIGNEKVISNILMVDITRNIYKEMRAQENLPQYVGSGVLIKPQDVCNSNSSLSMKDCFDGQSLNTLIDEYYYYRMGLERLSITALVNIRKDPQFSLPNCDIDGGNDCISLSGNNVQRTDTGAKIFALAEVLMDFQDFLPGLSTRSISKFWKKARGGSSIRNQLIPLRKLNYKKSIGMCVKP